MRWLVLVPVSMSFISDLHEGPAASADVHVVAF